MTVDSRVAYQEDSHIYDNSAPENDWIQSSIAMHPLSITESNDLYVEVHDEEVTSVPIEENEWENAAIWDHLSFEDNS